MSDDCGIEPRTPAVPGPQGPPGVNGNAYVQAIAAAAVADGAVVKRLNGGQIQTATGTAQGDDDGVFAVVHPAAAMGAMANCYQTGSRVPIAGHPVGPVYRSSTGTMTSSPVSGDYTVKVGYSDGTGVDLLFGEEFPAP